MFKGFVEASDDAKDKFAQKKVSDVDREQYWPQDTEFTITDWGADNAQFEDAGVVTTSEKVYAYFKTSIGKNLRASLLEFKREKDADTGAYHSDNGEVNALFRKIWQEGNDNGKTVGETYKDFLKAVKGKTIVVSRDDFKGFPKRIDSNFKKDVAIINFNFKK